eukprot:9663-Eustigmatos_ZCMA.PRE.1
MTLWLLEETSFSLVPSVAERRYLMQLSVQVQHQWPSLITPSGPIDTLQFPQPVTLTVNCHSEYFSLSGQLVRMAGAKRA